MITPVQFATGINHVISWRQKTVCMIPPVLYIRYYSRKNMSSEYGLYDTTNIIHSRYYSCKFVANEDRQYDTTSNTHSRYYSFKILPKESRLYDTTRTIHSRYYSSTFCQHKSFYMIKPVLSRAGNIHVRFVN